MYRQLTDIPISPIAAVNVASAPQRSPLRYPGGKTWLVPHIRTWLGGMSPRSEVLLEPFAGGAIVSLTAVMEGLAERAVMSEIDPDVAAFWHSALESAPALIRRIQTFAPTRHSVAELTDSDPHDVLERGFRALVLNRTRRGGILAPGASVSRRGENGRGIASRWYPATLAKRLRAIHEWRSRIEFLETDGVDLLQTFTTERGGNVAVFADPPYTFGGKRAGRRLYTYNDVDHERLFDILDRSAVNFLMTYDCSPEILGLISKHSFYAVRVRMKNTHHDKLTELVITPSPTFRKHP